MATIRGNARNAGLLCAVGLVFVPVAVAVRALPAHSFDWSAIDRLDRIEIGGRPEGASIVITDPKTLREFEKLVGTGYYETSHKCGDCSTITLCDRDNRSNYVLLHDSFGRSGGGFIQTVFVPRERAVFRRWFEEILKAHGQKPL